MRRRRDEAGGSSAFAPAKASAGRSEGSASKVEIGPGMGMSSASGVILEAGVRKVVPKVEPLAGSPRAAAPSGQTCEAGASGDTSEAGRRRIRQHPRGAAARQRYGDEGRQLLLPIVAATRDVLLEQAASGSLIAHDAGKLVLTDEPGKPPGGVPARRT